MAIVEIKNAFVQNGELVCYDGILYKYPSRKLALNYYRNYPELERIFIDDISILDMLNGVIPETEEEIKEKQRLDLLQKLKDLGITNIQSNTKLEKLQTKYNDYLSKLDSLEGVIDTKEGVLTNEEN